MTSWFRRGREERPDPTADPGATGPHGSAGSAGGADSPEALRRIAFELAQFINRNAGRLPVEAVVAAREVTDTVREVIQTSGEGELDVYAVVAINGIIDDYLPTTLRAYLNLDESVTSQPGASGRTPRQALREQLDSLNVAADDLLLASRAHDVDALFTQGNFLRTKFTRSDLDL